MPVEAKVQNKAVGGPTEFMKLVKMIQEARLDVAEAKCECLEKCRLQISQELDRLNGSFRRKESELIGPLINRYSRLEQRFEGLERQVRLLETKSLEQEQSMLVQERTMGLIIDYLSTLQQSSGVGRHMPKKSFDQFQIIQMSWSQKSFNETIPMEPPAHAKKEDSFEKESLLNDQPSFLYIKPETYPHPVG